MIVLDASVLIAFLDGSDLHHLRACALLDAAQDATLMVSALTLAEVLVGPTRAGRLAEAGAILDRLEIRTVPVDGLGAVALAEVRVRTRLRMPDACVLVAALDSGAQVATFDAEIVNAARLLGIPTFDP